MPFNLTRMIAGSIASTPRVSRTAFQSLPDNPNQLNDHEDDNGISPGSATYITPTPSSRVMPAPLASALHPFSSSTGHGSMSLPIPADASKDKFNQAPEPAFATGFIHVKGGKPKAADYNDIGQALVLRSAREFEARILGSDSFPGRITQGKWAGKAFKNSCRASGENFTVTDRIKRVLKARGSRIHGDILLTVRPAIINSYGFSLDVDRKAQRENRALYKKLVSDNFFVYKTKDIFGKPIGYAENKIVNVIIRRAWFKDGPSSIAVIFKRFFDPVSLNTLALIFTAVRFCLEEWSTGQWIKGPKFSQGTEYNSRFKPLLEDLIRWDAVVPSVTLKIRERMYKKCRDTLGIDGPSGGVSHVTDEVEDRMRLELEGRTGDTDSEDDFLDDDDDDADAEPLNAAGPGIDPASTELMNVTPLEQ
ncbi:hypothetical protein C8J56DRAFT_463443 [Mycena floridula]|nr:hypothetical protein C8J56DRAFT_463443 [Mycena floridula]